MQTSRAPTTAARRRRAGTARPPARTVACLACLALLLLMLAGACSRGDEVDADGPHARTDAVPGLVLRPGDTLFDHLRAIRVEASPTTNLPEELRATFAAIAEDPVRRIPRDAWRRSQLDAHGDIPARTLEAVTHLLDEPAPDAGGPLRLWAATPPVPLLGVLGPIELEHDGRPLGLPDRRTDASAQTPGYQWWLDDDTRTLFWWREPSGALIAFGRRAPNAVTYRFDLAAGTALSRAERRVLRGAPPPADGLELLGRTTIAPVTRPTLDAPAPARLVVDVGAFEADALDVAVGVGAPAAESRAATGESDGVTFGVRVEHDDGATLAWSRHVTAEDGFVEARVDLSAWEGTALRLVLETSVGPDGDATLDYGVWGELRVRGDARSAPERPHLVLVDVDTLRADRLGGYGYERPTSPRLDAWAAAHATVFTDVVSASNWTLPSTVSMLTGLAPHQHGVRRALHSFDASAAPVALRLRRAGYETFAFTDGGFVHATFGFDTGFDAYISRPRTTDERVRASLEQALQRLRSRRSERPVFCFVQTYMVHGPYRRDLRFVDPEAPVYDGPLAAYEEVPMHVLEQDEPARTPADEAYVGALYDAGVRRMDDLVGAFLEPLDEVFGDEPYLVVFTSDHGEELFERGEAGHGKTLYRELVGVPLIVRFHDGRPPGRSDRPASGLDVVPTLLDAAGLAVDAHLPGASLIDAPRATPVRVAEQSSGARAVLLGPWKLFEAPTGPRYAAEPPFLADRVEDPWERVNLADEHADVVARLRTLLDDYVEAYAPRADLAQDGALDEDTRAELQALGYLGDG